MADILIRGMEMPPEGYKTIILHSNGRVYEPTSEELIVNKIADATEMPPHGDLIEKDLVLEYPTEWFYDDPYISLSDIKAAPVVIPAERSDTDA